MPRPKELCRQSDAEREAREAANIQASDCMVGVTIWRQQPQEGQPQQEQPNQPNPLQFQN